MSHLWNTTRKDLSRARRDPFALLMWVAIPLILGTLITAVFGRGGATPQGRLLIADEDDTFVSNVLAGAFSREPLSKMVLVEKVSREEGRTRIDHGDASAFLVIPKGLADAVLQDQPFRLELLTNPAQSILPKIIQEVLGVVVEAEFYLHRVAGDELLNFSRRRDRNRPPGDIEIASYSVTVNHAIDRVRKYLIPPAIQLETSVASANASRKSFGAVLFPTFIFMAVIFTAGALANDIWKERNAGTLRRLRMTPAPLAAFLAGRLLFVMLVFAATGLMGVSVARWLANVPVAHFAGAVAWLVFSGAVFFLLLLCVVMQAETQRGASTLSNLVIFPLSMLGGTFFPFEQMPAWMVRIGSKTPNGLAVLQFYSILEGSVNLRSLALVAAGLSILSALAFVLALRRLRGGFGL
jgi:ABC-type multidrug transport system permease subunit